MKIAIIGQGAIAHYVRGQLAALGITEIAQIVRPGKEVFGDDTAPPCISQLADLPQRPDLIVDCGGHAALAAYGPDALARGIDVLTVSLGALADADLQAKLAAAADKGSARLCLASGAIGGLDALRSARAGTVTAVTYTGRKPPQGWRGSPAEDVLDLDNLTLATVHFSGTARAAALAYPKNANVAAAVALAGIGFDDTQVELIADPNAHTNIHEIMAEGTFGSFHFTISGHGLPENPRSSALAAMSVVADLAERQKQIGF
ncbi:MAG: aspartate dehydrogenase [Yoonia sp.]|uniref:aspartate dehydrogenase n=1 Tax=Yoonia sp. TaxID=2212373 RepID=UPI00273E2F28|nr:aspartate dehydrogenase [Yoonia sp.]MDP5085727.1 aspartate dehydrogenase [Yoonia sp.]